MFRRHLVAIVNTTIADIHPFRYILILLPSFLFIGSYQRSELPPQAGDWRSTISPVSTQRPLSSKCPARQTNLCKGSEKATT